MNELDTAYRLSPRCRFRVVGDEGVIVRLDAAEVVAINGIGASILTLMREGEHSLREIASSLTARFQVDVATATRDCVAFAAELEAAGIVEKVDAR